MNSRIYFLYYEFEFAKIIIYKFNKLGYIGCYKDNGNGNLNFGPYTPGSLTIEQCLTYCVVQGFKYSGLENG